MDAPAAALNEDEKAFAFVEALADAQTRPNFRDLALNLLSDLFGFNDSVFFLVGTKDLAAGFPIYRHVATSLIDRYWSAFPTIDVFYQALQRAGLFARPFVEVKDLLSREEYEGSALYRDVMEPAGFHTFGVLPLQTGRDVGGIVAIMREKSQGAFPAAERRLLARLNGPLARALDGYLAMSELRSERDFYKTAFNELREGVLLLGPHHEVQLANAAAERTCAEVFAEDPARATAKLVGSLASRMAGASPSRAEVELESERLGIRLVPVVLPSPLYNLEHRTIAYLTRTGDADDTYRKLATTYHLSERELEVVRLVGLGCDNAEVARRLFLSQHTVKTHVQNIFRKLDISSRNSINRLLSELERKR